MNQGIKRHTGYRRYANLHWWDWQDINDHRDRERRLIAKAVADAVRSDVREILEKNSQVRDNKDADAVPSPIR